MVSFIHVHANDQSTEEGESLYRHDAKDPVTRRGESISRAPLRRGEQFRREAVQYRVRDIACKAEGAVPTQQRP